MPGLPEAQVLCVEPSPDLLRFDVLCPHCRQVHHHQWNGTDTRFSVPASCDPGQRYRVRLTQVHTTRDDQAIDVPVPNWTE